MLSFRQFMLRFKHWLYEIKGDKYVHGTLADHLPSIKKNWLRPSVGKFTKRFYDDATPAVFLQNHIHIAGAVSAIKGHIGLKLNKHPSKVNGEDIEKHGALVIHTPDEDEKENLHHDRGGGVVNHWGQHMDSWPHQTESGDTFSLDDVRPTGILKGKRLRHYLRKREYTD